MANKRLKIENIKDWLLLAAILFGGIALTVTSFCVYFLIEPLHGAVLALLCVADFIDTVICTCWLFKTSLSAKWCLKGALAAVGYIAAFIVVATLFLLFCEAEGLLAKHIVDIVFYAFFTGPSIFIVVPIALLLLSGM